MQSTENMQSAERLLPDCFTQDKTLTAGVETKL